MKKINKLLLLIVWFITLSVNAEAQGQGNNSENTAFGFKALFSNSTGLNNSAFGFKALYFNTTGYENSANGSNTLYSNTTGFFNTAHGVNSLFSNTGGNSNTAGGWLSLASNTVGNANTATGVYSLVNNIAGGGNTAHGMQALFSNNIGSNNAAYGFDALALNTTGFNNTALGYAALFNNGDGFFNTALGSYANVSSGNLFNATAIGFNTFVSASNSVRVGNTAVTSIGGQVGWTTFSDGRYKSNIKNNVPGLEFITKLQPITYTLNTESIETKLQVNMKELKNNQSKFKMENKMDMTQAKTAINEKSKITYTGFIAQDVEKAAKQIGYDFSGVDKPKDDGQSFYGLRYDEFVVPLVKAVQELAEQNKELKERLDKIVASLDVNFKSEITENSKTIVLSSAKLEQNIPNPAKQSTLINYYVPENMRHAEIQVIGLTGEIIKRIELSSKGNGQLILQTNFLNSGTYTYSLIIDGIITDTKKMVLIK